MERPGAEPTGRFPGDGGRRAARQHCEGASATVAQAMGEISRGFGRRVGGSFWRVVVGQPLPDQGIGQ
eukprot:3003940-Pyramimonas_sp.AAC.1